MEIYMKNLNTKLSNERKILEEAEKIIKQANQTNPQKNSSSNIKTNYAICL